MTIAPPAPTAAPIHRGVQPVPQKTPRYAWWGALAVAIALGAGVLVFASFGGQFTNYVEVTAELPASSTAVALDSPVE